MLDYNNILWLKHSVFDYVIKYHFVEGNFFSIMPWKVVWRDTPIRIEGVMLYI